MSNAEGERPAHNLIFRAHADSGPLQRIVMRVLATMRTPYSLRPA